MNSKIIINLSLMGATLGLVACNNAPKEETRMEKQVDNALEDITQAKDDAAKNMRALHEKLAIRLVKVEAKLKEPGTTKEQQQEWEASRVELKDQMKRLEDGIGEVDRSTNETWKDVKEGTRKTTEDVDNWFQRQAEIIDRKTDADKDKDGH
ncbi:MAG: hypothetical protein IPN85_17615 [Flavobacteriales bacterium]|jgi:phage shock protein A|nr:hypothetical protein [Flavobacteriales bacterium]MBL0035247.1 hypothetical protein [Flavobacteriales bacterium]